VTLPDTYPVYIITGLFIEVNILSSLKTHRNKTFATIIIYLHNQSAIKYHQLGKTMNSPHIYCSSTCL